MISEKILPFEEMLHDIQSNQLKTSFPLEYTLEQMKKIKERFAKADDSISRLLKLAKPIVELIFYRMGYHEPVKPASTPGRKGYPTDALLLVHFLAQTFVADSYRQVQRMIEAHPRWLKALGLEKAPDHTTMSKFRTARGEEFFHAFFRELTSLLDEFGLFPKEATAIIDSAPIEASQNFARSNAGIEINEERVKSFFDRVDFTPAVNLIAPACTQGRKRKYSNEQILKFVAFEKLCGFLSRSQALRHLKKHPNVAHILGLAPDDIPSQATITNYLERIPPIPWLMRVMVEPMTEFFHEQLEYDDADPLSFFFRTV